MTRLQRFGQVFKSFYTGRYALVTNTLTAGTMGFVADSVAQFVETKTEGKEWDKTRSKNMTTIAFGFGPVLHYWYRFLDTKFPGKKGASVGKKVFWDVAVAPIFYIGYLGALCFLKDFTFHEFVVEFKEKLPLLLGADLAFWPILQSVNFLFVPPYYRIIGLKFNELVLGIVFSHLVNNSYSLSGLINWIKTR